MKPKYNDIGGKERIKREKERRGIGQRERVGCIGLQRSWFHGLASPLTLKARVGWKREALKQSLEKQ